MHSIPELDTQLTRTIRQLVKRGFGRKRNEAVRSSFPTWHPLRARVMASPPWGTGRGKRKTLLIEVYMPRLYLYNLRLYEKIALGEILQHLGPVNLMVDRGLLSQISGIKRGIKENQLLGFTNVHVESTERS